VVVLCVLVSVNNEGLEEQSTFSAISQVLLQGFSRKSIASILRPYSTKFFTLIMIGE
jgi:hypothetical protein